MAKICAICGKTPQTGNTRSHANNKSRRRFLPNVQHTSLLSETLGRMVRLKLSVNGIRTIEKAGGLDAYLKAQPTSKLDPAVARIKRQIERKAAAS